MFTFVEGVVIIDTSTQEGKKMNLNPLSSAYADLKLAKTDKDLGELL